MTVSVRPESNDQARLSRSEIESLCMMYAIGDRGCNLDELPERLGLSPDLVEPVSKATRELAARGLLAVTDTSVMLTDKGETMLERRLSESDIKCRRPRE